MFSIGVEWPSLEPVIRRLIKLPHYRVVDVLFWWVYKLHKGFAIYTRVHPVKPSPRRIAEDRTAFHADQELIAILGTRFPDFWRYPCELP